MRNTLLSFFLIFTAFECMSQVDSASSETFKKEYYSIKKPKGWTLNESGLGGTDCFIISPKANSNDSFTENVNIIRTPLEEGQQETRDEGIQRTIKMMGKMMNNFKLLSQEKKVVNGLETDILVYTHTQGILELKLEQRFVLANNQMYILTATESAVNPHFIKQLSEILDSFQLKMSEN